ncbi:MAG: insulinase family protein [Chloroflexi bacterium]|nr:insulinase family protein [Chloroflexota bacterium]
MIPNSQNVTRAVLKNGAVVLIYENHASPAVVIRGHLRAGSMFEPPAQSGLALFTAEMVDRGTRKRSFQQIAEQTERVGAAVGMSSGVHLAGFSAKSLSEDMRLLLDILSEVLREPAFLKAEMEKVRGELLTSIEERADSTDAMANLAFHRMAYPNHPYGRDPLGSRASVNSIKRADLQQFYARHYRPEGMALAIVGDVRTDDALRLAGRLLGGWTAPGTPPAFNVPPARPRKAMQRRHIKMKGKTQSDIVLGAPALPRMHPDFLAAELADVILGEFGMMGRMGDNVRDRLGLAYYARSTLESAPGPGAWMAYAGVNPQNVDTAVAAMLSEMERMKQEPVSDAELNDVKEFVTGIQPLRLESNDGIASALLDMEFYELGLDYLLQLPSLVRAVTPAQVQSAAQQYLDTERYALVVAGP